ncbi:hypothetical protein GALL_543750 [mine drainage metagenome]|uniref:Uncharacterized protein n=1 Tax=mine drainage metagenome TaxID=410659 RepID=A0A1J5NZ34_9ZZZZ
MGVDQQRCIQLVGRTGKFRQHQNAGVGWVLRGDVFLGDEIHPVMQGRYDANLGGAVQSRQYGLAKPPVEIADRGPVHFAMAAVDVADEFCKFALQIAVGLDCATRGYRDLQQGHRARKRRLQGPHPVERIDTVDEPLGIIQPIDANRQLLAVQASPQPRYIGVGHGLGGLPREFFGIDADRKNRDA